MLMSWGSAKDANDRGDRGGSGANYGGAGGSGRGTGGEGGEGGTTSRDYGGLRDRAKSLSGPVALGFPSRASPGGGYHGKGGALGMGYHGTGADLDNKFNRGLQSIIGHTMLGRGIEALTGYDFSKGLGPAYGRKAGTGPEGSGGDNMPPPLGGILVTSAPRGIPAPGGDAAGLPATPGAGLFDELAGMAREKWDMWKQHGLGALTGLGADIDASMSPGAIAAEEGLAATNVGAAYARQKEGLMRNLGRYGVNPASGRFTSALRSLALGQAADTAGAQTRARRGILDRGLANKFRLAGMWQGIGDTAGSMLGGAASGLAGLDLAGREMAFRGSQADLNRAHDLMLAKMGYKQQAKSDKWGAIGQIGGSLIGGALMSGFFSDRRLKRNIVEIDCFPNGLKVYEFEYNDEPGQLYTGFMADEVEELMPQHVGEVGGFKTVHYGGVIKEMLDHG